MHDAARLERQGIPTTVVAWDTFAYPAKLQAQILGIPDLPIVVIPHNTPADFNAEVEGRRAEGALEAVVAALTAPLPVSQP
ncbi:MAG: hypothetical protein HY329_02400 [Chloroflexi bacterium]|nr:hypothetical protein [Chloroflexota bacterium]